MDDHPDEEIKDRTSVRLTRRYALLLAWLVRKGFYTNESEAVRAGLRKVFEAHGILNKPLKEIERELEEK